MREKESPHLIGYSRTTYVTKIRRYRSKRHSIRQRIRRSRAGLVTDDVRLGVEQGKREGEEVEADGEGRQTSDRIATSCFSLAVETCKCVATAIIVMVT